MRTRLALILLALGLACAGCGGASSTDSVPASTPRPTPRPEIIVAAGAPITIGVSVALSGDQVNIGGDIADAAELAIADKGGTVAGHPLQASRKDDGCTDPERAVAVARSFVADASVAGVIGPMCTTGAQAANPLYELARIVHISPSATRVELPGQGEQYFFRTAWRDDMQAEVQADYARHTANAGTAVVVDDAEPYGKGLADAFVTRFQELGGNVLSRERIARGTTDFSSSAKRIASMAPDIVVYEGLNPEVALLVKELRNDQYAKSFMAPDGAFSARDYLLAAGAAAEGSVVSGGPQASLDFVARFHSRFGRDPSTAFVLQAYDAVSALIAAINSVATASNDGSLRIDRARLAAAVRDERILGLTGAISFDEHGDRRGVKPAEVGLVLYKVTNGAFVPLP
jgi:branched-chain amino acid transport system substrate-binding protein